MNNKYIQISDFSLNWRFTDEKYNLLLKQDLIRILPLNKEESSSKWKSWISAKAGHYMELDNLKKEHVLVTIRDCGWGENIKKMQRKIN